jgi:hypothetical protein
MSQTFYENKIGFSVLASAVLMNLLKKQQRRVVGLSVFSDGYEYYAPEKAVIAITGWFKRARKPIARLSCHEKNRYRDFCTNCRIHRRSMIVIFLQICFILARRKRYLMRCNT